MQQVSDSFKIKLPSGEVVAVTSDIGGVSVATKLHGRGAA